MSDLYIYESGSLTRLFKESKENLALEWREKLDNWALDNGFKTFNPAKNFKNNQCQNYNDKLIVDQNEFYLNKTNIMVVQLDYIDYSPGTIYELATYRKMQKPVIAFGETRHWSSHINSAISQQYKNIDEVIEVLANMFI